MLWGDFVGAVLWDEATGTASFEYDRAFLSKGLDISPIHMPVAAPRIYSFGGLSRDTFMGLPGLLADSLRHTCGSLLVESGVGIEHIRDLPGHTDTATTRIYIEMAVRRKTLAGVIEIALKSDGGRLGAVDAAGSCPVAFHAGAIQPAVLRLHRWTVWSVKLVAAAAVFFTSMRASMRRSSTSESASSNNLRMMTFFSRQLCPSSNHSWNLASNSAVGFSRDRN